MRTGRFVTNDEVADIDQITGLRFQIDLKNNVTISWAWPRNGGVKLAAVIPCETGDEPLAELLQAFEPIIVTKDLDKSYNKPLAGDSQRFKVYPAYFGEGSDIVLLNQRAGNTTGRITKMVTVDYKLSLKPVPLSDYQRVELTVRASGRLPSDDAIYYCKLRGGVRLCSYPLDCEPSQYLCCYIKKNETIKIRVSDEYAGNIVLREERAD